MENNINDTHISISEKTKEKYTLPEGLKGLFISILIVIGFCFIYLSRYYFLYYPLIIKNGHFFYPCIFDDPDISLSILLLLTDIIEIILFYYVIFPWINIKRTEYKPLKLSRTIISLIMFSIMCVITYLVQLSFILLFKFPNLSYIANLYITKDISIFKATLFLCLFFIMPPVVSEVIFRRLTIPYLEQKGLSPIFAVASSSIGHTIYLGLLSAASTTNFILYFITTLGIEIILGIIYIYTRNIVYPVIMSVIYNFISFPIHDIELLGDADLVRLYYLVILIIFLMGLVGIILFIIKFLKNPDFHCFRFLKEKSSSLEFKDSSPKIVTKMTGKSLKDKPNVIISLIIFSIITILISAMISKSVTFLYYIPYTNDVEDTFTHPDQVKKWTFLFYDVADYFDMGDVLKEFESETFSGENLSTIALRDLFPYGADMWYIDTSHNRHLLKTMGEPNMGDPKTLENFINYAKANFPAERYALAIYSHGAAWAGCCGDQSSHYDWLSMDEMQEALDNSGNIDLLFFMGPCNIGSLEVVYEIRNNVDLCIGGEYRTLWIWCYNMLEDLCETFNSNPDIKTNELGKRIIDLLRKNNKDYLEFVSAHYTETFTINMIAVQTNETELLIEKIDQLSSFCIDNLEIIRSKFSLIFDKVVNYGNALVDFYSLLIELESVAIEEDLIQNSTLFQEVKQAYDQIIVDIYHSAKVNSKGLNIYFPDSSIYLDNRYYQLEYGLDFSRDTHWDEFLLQLWNVDETIVK